MGECLGIYDLLKGSKWMIGHDRSSIVLDSEAHHGCDVMFALGKLDRLGSISS
jgi:hypothetical protein